MQKTDEFTTFKKFYMAKIPTINKLHKQSQKTTDKLGEIVCIIYRIEANITKR